MGKKKDSLPPICETWRAAAKRRTRSDVDPVDRGIAKVGISFQFPPGWDDGSGKVRHVPKGQPHAGRVMFTSKQEAIDIGKRHEDVSGLKTSYGA
jgi:hypothetical protein